MMHQDMQNPTLADIIWYERLSHRDKTDTLPLDISPDAHPFVRAGEDQCFYCSLFGHRQVSCPMREAHQKGKSLAGKNIGRQALPLGQWRRVKNGKTYSVDMLGSKTHPIQPVVTDGLTTSNAPITLTSVNQPPASYVPDFSTSSVHPPLSPGLSSSDEEYLAQMIADMDANSDPMDEGPVHADRADDIILLDENECCDIYGDSMAIEVAPIARPVPNTQDVNMLVDDCTVIPEDDGPPVATSILSVRNQLTFGGRMRVLHGGGESSPLHLQSFLIANTQL
ncbi:uncharacterized protein MELLADRAFT_62157 [Melampsora larici-populina 98AG31]|uniref:CCHC-type domain-containing protein n=1 Tax=Melampsora larici-populina (strain 98AG31 / pathotype 3-4-7) TaxID=747676 RepID=F4RHT4_MELLP|nr:uncharacterized protein MELLADRAFT_62157 [Melampsora larici-populina 98AG31]EGG08081.1 hypothetical protein MELLADRAFT_62157 [Melampsora larici-populina 98AG31]